MTPSVEDVSAAGATAGLKSGSSNNCSGFERAFHAALMRLNRFFDPASVWEIRSRITANKKNPSPAAAARFTSC